MQNSAVIRLKDDCLAWYPPGAGGELSLLDSAGAREQLLAVLGQPGVSVCFAAPAVDVRLCTLEVNPRERKHVEKSLSFMLEEELVDDVEDLHFASVMATNTSLQVALCAHRKMRHWQALLAGFPGVNLWLPEQLLLPWREGEWCVVIEEHQATVRTGLFSGFGVEPDMLGVLLSSALAEEGNPPARVVLYGQDQGADTAAVPAQLRDRVQWRRGDFGTALMLAEPAAQTINLLQGDYSVRLPLKRWARQWRVAAAVLAVAFTVQLAATWAEYAALQNENLELRRAIEFSYRKAYPKGAMVDPQKQLQRQLGALRGSAQAGGFVSLIGRVGEVVNKTPGTRIASINYSDKSDEIRMNVTAPDFESVETLRLGMNEAGLDAVMENSNAQGDRVRARLRVGAGT